MRRSLPGSAASVACVAATAVAVAATRHAAHADGSPVAPVNHWHAAWIVGTLAALALCAAGVLLARAGRLRLRVALVAAIVIQVLPIAAPLLLSRDVFLYWAEARVITVHHHSAYSVTPSAYPNDPATREASAEWRTQKEPYGPVWAAIGTVPAAAAGSSAHAAQLAYRLLALGGILALLAVLYRRTHSVQALALVGWNPLVALHYAGGGHSDAILVLVLVGATALGASAAGGVLWPLAALIKPVPLVVLPLELARRRLRLPRRFWVALVATAVVLAVAGVVALGTGWISTSTIAAHGASPIGGVHFLHQAGLRHRYAVVVAGLVFVAVYLVLLRTAWRSGKAHLGFALAALCMCSSLLRPWYALWPLALAALEEDGLSVGAAFALSGYCLIADAIPH